MPKAKRWRGQVGGPKMTYLDMCGSASFFFYYGVLL